MLARDLQSVIIYDSSGAFAGVRRSGSELPITVDGVTIVIDDVIGSTGLEMKVFTMILMKPRFPECFFLSISMQRSFSLCILGGSWQPAHP